MSENGNGIGDIYQKETKYDRETLGGGLDWASRAETYKIYEGAPRFTLPEPEVSEGSSLWRALNNRRSVRNFRRSPFTPSQLSQLLWAVNGVTLDVGEWQFRATPSAGALYPVETYVAINRGEEIVPGVYHHAVRAHALELLKEGDFGPQLASACLGQSMCASASAVFIFTAIPARSKWKYGERAYRYIYLDAGHAGAGLHLAAEALGLGCCMIGAFFDDELNSILGIDGVEETAVYAAAVGAR